MGEAIAGDGDGTEEEKEGDRHLLHVSSPPTFQPWLHLCIRIQVIAPGAARRYAPADGSSTRGGSTSVRSPHMAKLQAASVPIA